MPRGGPIFGPQLCEHDSRAGCGGFGFSSLPVTRLRRFLLLAPVVLLTGHETRFLLLPFWFPLLPAPLLRRALLKGT